MAAHDMRSAHSAFQDGRAEFVKGHLLDTTFA